MSLQHYTEQYLRPTGPLQSAIRHSYWFESGIDQPVERVVLPNFQVSILFNLGDPQTLQLVGEQTQTYSLNRVAVLGPLRQAAHFQSQSGGKFLSVNFSFEGFYRFFQFPVQELTGSFPHPDDLLKQSCFELIWEQLMETSSLKDRAAIIDAFSRPYLRSSEKNQSDVVQLLNVSRQQPHLNPVKWMAQEQRISERAVQLRFQKYLGFSPKEYMRFLRFQRVLNQLRTSTVLQPDWYDFVEQQGYHDQSHLIHDFNHFVGQAPRQLIQELTKENLHCSVESSR